jgi:hypothetical protein
LELKRQINTATRTANETDVVNSGDEEYFHDNNEVRNTGNKIFNAQMSETARVPG